MDVPSNQSFVKLPIESTTALKNLKVCFCIDNSGSTASNYNRVIETRFASRNHPTNNSLIKILDIEKAFTTAMKFELNTTPTFVSWNSVAINVESLDQIGSTGGTDPSSIFDTETFNTVANADVLVLITDGQIDSEEIRLFGGAMTKFGTHLQAIIGVIVGKRSASPADTNVSVLVPAMISNGCILGSDAEESVVMWSCGAFKSAWNPTEIVEETTWDSVTKINPAAICELEIPSANKAQEDALRSSGYIPMGSGLFFHPNNLLASEPTWDDLVTLPFDRICQYFKVTNRCEELVNWFKKLNDKFVAEFTANPEEKFNVDRLISEIEQGHRPQRDANVLSSYRTIRNRALVRQHIADDYIDDLLDDPRLVTLMQFFRNMMEIMREDQHTQHDAGTYTTSSMAPSRYVSYTKKVCGSTTKSTGSRQPVTRITAKFNEPFKWFQQFNKLYTTHNTPTSECSICYESSVPFVMIRKHFDINNVEDMMTHPSDYFYPQVLCAKCAGYFCNLQTDPVRVPCYGAIPMVNLVADSKKSFLEGFATLTNVSYGTPTEPTSAGLFESIAGFMTSMTTLFVKSVESSMGWYGPEDQLLSIISLFCIAAKSFCPENEQMVLAIDQFRAHL